MLALQGCCNNNKLSQHLVIDAKNGDFKKNRAIKKLEAAITCLFINFRSKFVKPIFKNKC